MMPGNIGAFYDHEFIAARFMVQYKTSGYSSGAMHPIPFWELSCAYRNFIDQEQRGERALLSN
jgi:hypothetical protein